KDWKSGHSLGMSTVEKFKSMSGALPGLSRLALSVLFSSSVFSALALGAGPFDPPGGPNVTPEPAPREATDRSGAVQTRDGLTLHLTTDLGSVHIVALEPGAPPVVRYTVHIETDARLPLARGLLDRYSLTAKSTASGVEIVGTSPSQVGRGGA